MIAALRVLLVTDGAGDAARIVDVVGAAAAGGVRAVQVREPGMTAAALGALCAQLRELLAPQRGVVLVNDRVDVAAAGAADGAHVGRRSLPPALARRALPRPALLSAAVHDRAELDRAAPHCDLVVLAPVWPTATKPGAAPLGVAKAGELTAASPVPVLWLGGVTADRARTVAELPARQRPVGFAAIGALSAAADVERAARALVAAAAHAVAGPGYESR